MVAPWKAGPIGRVFPAVPRIIIERAGCALTALTHANIALMLTRHETTLLPVAVCSEHGGQGAANQEVDAVAAVAAVAAVDAVDAAATSATTPTPTTPEIGGASSERNLALSVGDDDARSSASSSSTFSAISTVSVSRLYNAHEYTHEPYEDEPMDAERGAGRATARANAAPAYEDAVRFITQTEADELQFERRRHVTGEGVYYYPRFESVHEERRAQKAPRRSCIEIGSTVFAFGTVVAGMVTLTFLGHRVLRTHSGEFNARVVRHEDALVVVAVGQILVFREIVVDSSWMNDLLV
jgi:hypothetical protein